MKKMLLAFAVMAFAAVAQAVALAWTTPTANGWYDGSMACTFIYAADANNATAEDAVAVAMGAADDSYNKIGWQTQWADEYEGYSYTDVATRTDAGVYFIVFTKGDAYAVSSVLAANTTNAWTPAMGSPETEINFAPIEIADFKGTLVPVPEPTALALLALGVAGLALRRRA